MTRSQPELKIKAIELLEVQEIVGDKGAIGFRFL